MTEEKEFKQWGLPYNPAYKHCRGTCPYCGKMMDTEYFKYVVGFTVNIPFRSPIRTDVGIFIIECPNCFEKYWIHTNIGMVLAFILFLKYLKKETKKED
jgi:hypothetical protein